MDREIAKDIHSEWEKLYEYWITSSSNKTFNWVCEIKVKLWTAIYYKEYRDFLTILDEKVLKTASQSVRKTKDADKKLPKELVSKIREKLAILKKNLS